MATLVGGVLYVPKPPLQTEWQKSLERSRILAFLTVGGQPARKLQWRPHYDYVDTSLWEGKPYRNFILQNTPQQIIYGAPGQAPTKFWRYDYQEQTFWVWEPPPSQLTANDLRLHVVVRPCQPTWTYHEPSLWSWEPPPNCLSANDLRQHVVIFSKAWHYDYNDSSVWTWSAPPSRLDMSLHVVVIPKVTQFYSEPSPWQRSTPVVNPLLYIVTGTTTTMPADPGAYVLTGKAVLFNISMAEAKGTYNLTGQTTTYHFNAPESAGAYTLTGQAANLTGKLTGTPGVYTLSGKSIILSFNAPLTKGTYNLTGQAAQQARPVSAGSYTLTGRSIIFAFDMPEGKGTYLLTGRDATLIDSGATPSANSDLVIWRRRRRK
jgi:hypothetical protein